MHNLYKEQDNGWWADRNMLFIRCLGERSSQVFGSGAPFQVDNLHVGIVVNGEQDVTVNLRQHHLTRGSLLIASPESIMQENGRSEDFDMRVIHVSDDHLHKLFGDQVPQHFAHRMSDLVLHPDEATFELLMTMLNALWQAVHLDEAKNPGITDTRHYLLAASLDLITNLSQQEEQSHTPLQPRNVIVFNRFLNLVAEHCDSQRTLDFYASQLCLSKQYLGSIIIEVSHRSAREWIDEAVLQRIKVMLLHSTMPLNDISERMSFAEPSNFSRFFKRLTGITPNAFRCGKNPKK